MRPDGAAHGGVGGVTGDLRQLTAEARGRVDEAKKHGDLCAGCGRGLDADEPVYVARVWVGTKLFGDPSSVASRIVVEAPFGVECVSTGFRVETDGVEPERCDGCGRSMYYEASGPRSRRALCSARCQHRRIRR